MSYDAASRLEVLWNLKSAGTIISSFDYRYDAVGNRTRAEEADRTVTTYTYDATNQLESEERYSP